MLLALILACSSSSDQLDDSGEDTASSSEAGLCNPVDDGHCLLPFPSDYFTVQDANTGTGRRVQLATEVLPVNVDHQPMRADHFNELDGWSTLGELLVWLPDATLDGVVGWQDLGAYADADVKTVIVDAETGQRVPHFVERDVFAAGSDRQMLVLRPVEPMKHATTYVVGIRGLVDEAGAPVEGPDGFVALRDGTNLDDPGLQAQQTTYEDLVFPTLDAQGFARDTLQHAWSFTTTSKEGSLGKAIWLRDDALAWAEDGGIAYSLDTPEESDCTTGATIGRKLTGWFEAPLYLEADEPGSILTRDADGWPYRNGTKQVDFTVRIPCSVLDADAPGGLVQFGHGLLGNQGEVNGSSLGDLANDYGQVLAAIDWTGMSEDDRLAVTTMIIDDPGGFAIIPEMVQQAYVEQALLGRFLTGSLAADPLFQTSDGQGLVDPDRMSFYGISQGAILGGGFGALSLDHDDVVLGMAGTPFTLLLARSEGFLPFLLILQGMYDDPADVSLIIAMMQQLWDPGESAGYARFFNEEPLDAITPPKDALIIAGIGDALVPTLGAHVMARAYGATSILPANRSVWGVPEAEPPFTGSAFIEWDFGVKEPVEAVPADLDAEVHWSVTGRSDARELIGHWLTTGEAIDPCDGACDPD